MNLNIDELKRFYYDINGLEQIKLEKIKEIQAMGHSMHPNIDSYYYAMREG